MAMGKWVKCSDRLPEESGYYLTYTSWDWISVNEYSSRWEKWNISDKSTNEDWISKVEMKNITHWMPLPAGPEDKE